jgi:hypothetical protein
MVHKRNTKLNKIQYRRVINIGKKQLLLLNDSFSAFGTKTDFQREYNIPRQTVTRILSAGRGEDRIVKAMQEYCKKQ